MIRTDRRIRICGILLVLNLCFIWGNSLLPGELSGALSDWVKDLLASLLPVGEDMPSQGGLLRKRVSIHRHGIVLSGCLDECFRVDLPKFLD